MAKVRILPQVLAHQIAAGEIVERPASVVKELLENAIDAESTVIHIAVAEGGRQLIQITDNGIGMTAEDAQLAFEHHATSKIQDFDDLMAIRTLGFRGEALPSIASVSRTRLRTVDRESVESGSTLGTEIEFEGGILRHVREIAWPNGTEVTIEDLFYNVPARRKFLKTVSTELSHISRLVMCYALAYPGIEFRLEHGSKKILDVTAVTNPRDRVYQLMGENLIQNLVPMEYEVGGVRVSGFASLPHEQRNNANALYLFVNRRMVRDRVLTHAIRQAYRDLIPAVAYPVVILFIDIEPEMIDVNVHPTKTEIRFRQSQNVYSGILKAIDQALLLNRENLASLARDVQLTGLPVSSHSEGISRSIDRYMQRSASSFGSYGTPGFFPSTAFGNRAGTGTQWPGAQAPEEPAGEGVGSQATGPFPEYSARVKPGSHGDGIPETAHLSAAPAVLGQFVESFIVAVDREGVMVIDQHVAHERILYDKALRTLEGDREVGVQKLLLPVTLELNPQQTSVAQIVMEHLNANGFDVEWFGQNALVVRAVPALAKDLDPRLVLEELFEELESLDEIREGSMEADRSVRRLREKIAISLSCRAAIKINTPLTPEKMQWLLDELFRCDNPYTCPHGRPIILRLNIEEILRGFKRI